MATDTARERVIADLASSVKGMAEQLCQIFSIDNIYSKELLNASLQEMADAGRRAGYAEGLEDAARKAESAEDIWNAGKDWNSACNAVAAAIRKPCGSHPLHPLGPQKDKEAE